MAKWLGMMVTGFVVTFAAMALEVGGPEAEAGSAGATPEWVHAMEASFHHTPRKVATPPSPPSRQVWMTWLGWGIAVVFFLVLLSLHIKMKRRERFLLRGGDRDFFILPPARNRRRSPR